MSILDKIEERGIEKGIEKGIERGIVKGIEKRNIEVAKILLGEGAEIALVAKVTGLSKEEILKLKREN